jgi:DNA polymerase sigma
MNLFIFFQKEKESLFLSFSPYSKQKKKNQKKRKNREREKERKRERERERKREREKERKREREKERNLHPIQSFFSPPPARGKAPQKGATPR